MKECYIDMHCHILPGVDDGAKDLAETKKMLEIAYAEGIRCIIATPHHHPHRGKASVENLRERAKLVREAAHEIDERFRVYLGTEVYFGQDVADKLKEGKILSMNRREYVLVEFPPSQTYSYIRQGIQQLQFAGYEVILAHVERYHCIAENVELAEELYDMGVNLQVNADSITGGSGRKIRKFIEELMNRDLVFCVFHQQCSMLLTDFFNLFYISRKAIKFCINNQFYIRIHFKGFFQCNRIHSPRIILSINKYRNSTFINNWI